MTGSLALLRICASLASAATLAAIPPDRVEPAGADDHLRFFTALHDLPAETGPAQTLSVLTYNVHGLPEFLRKSQTAPLSGIGQRLRALRAEGRQPGIVLLQEAFTDAAKQIGPAAGYRYIVDGPSTTQPGEIAAEGITVLDTESHWWAGEDQGKYADSGLQILSDYPVLAVRRLPFPEKACAGFDCLANKGVLLVTVALPGHAVPVDIVTTHLNSRGAAGVATSRTAIAFERQVAALFAFLAKHRRPERPLVLAGDFNIGSASERQASFFAQVESHAASLPLRDAMALMAKRNPAAFPECAQEARERAKDWQFWIDGTAMRLDPTAIDVPFGHEPDGSMLSDHIGFAAEYRISASVGPSR